jgi:hypothetical protein
VKYLCETGVAGSLLTFRSYGGYSPLPLQAPFDLAPPGAFGWVDASTLYGTNTVERVFSQNNAYVFTDDENAFVDTNAMDLINNVRQNSASAQMVKMTREEWLLALEDAYEANNVPEAQEIDLSSSDASYPTKEELCGGVASDPSCTESPYQEPDAKVDAGAIAGFTVLGAALLVLCLHAIYRRQLKIQRRRVQKRFIRGVAQNITIAPTAGGLDTNAILKEFKHIDKDKGGTITKEELQVWLKDGKLGEISQSDFNVMWVAMDVDGNGSVDFVEFCTFMSGCGDAFDEVYKEEKNISKDEKLERASRRLSTMVSIRNLGDLAKVDDLEEDKENADA